MLGARAMIRVLAYASSAAVALAIGVSALTAQSMPWGGFGTGQQVESDAFQGDWSGQWETGRSVAAQVVSRGNGNYQVRIQDSFDQRYAPYIVATARLEDGSLRLEEGSWLGVFKDGRFEGRGDFRNGDIQNLTLSKTTYLSSTLGLEPPENAVVLFDGSDLDEWESSRGDGKMEWKLVNSGAMEIGMDANRKGHGAQTRKAFKDLTLHLEFRLPLLPFDSGQKRANSGLFIDGYEIQILDSYGLEGYNNECGAFYKFKAPSVNRCAPPLQWQTYDVTYRAARFNADGSVEEWPRFTVRHNGGEIHRDLPMTKAVYDKSGALRLPAREPKPISLQFHGAPIQFRNIWVVAD